MKESVLDPQGLAILNALKEISFSNVENVRMGKYIQLWIHSPTKEEATKQADEICKKLLVNEVIETYRFEVI